METRPMVFQMGMNKLRDWHQELHWEQQCYLLLASLVSYQTVMKMTSMRAKHWQDICVHKLDLRQGPQRVCDMGRVLEKCMGDHLVIFLILAQNQTWIEHRVWRQDSGWASRRGYRCDITGSRVFDVLCKRTSINASRMNWYRNNNG